MNSTERSGIGDYFRAFSARWFILMSGPLSVPAALAAAWFENTTARILLALTAAACFVFSSYWVWKIEREKRLAAEAQIAVVPRPDWPIHELFCLINPDFLDRTDDRVDESWDKVGNDIRDQASLGHLKIWGRVVRNGPDRILGQREALRLIEPSYWRTAFFTYSFFDNTAGDVPHTYLGLGQSGVLYTNLLVNRDEALSLWPRAPK